MLLKAFHIYCGEYLLRGSRERSAIASDVLTEFAKPRAKLQATQR